MLRRLITNQIASSKKSILLLGPRQTGKSTLLKSLSPDLTINLANENQFLRHSADAGLLESIIAGNSNTKTVLIDEIQRVPFLLNTIQALIDDASPENKIQFLLSGSSARKLRRGNANLLPGRLFTYNLGGLCARELDYKVNLNQALRYGALPEPYLEKEALSSEKLLDSYASTYLKEEIQAEALSRNIPGFARFLDTIAAQSGDILDFSKISTKSKVSRSSCVRFIEILEDTLIAKRVNVFEDVTGVDLIKHPKLYFFDIGVINSLQGSFDISPSRRGMLFEHFIYSQIVNSAFAHDEAIKLNYFRTRSGVEVDFILTKKKKVWAIEVKSGEISSGDLAHLKRFREYYPETHQCIAVGMKEQRRRIDDILVCDWKEFLVEIGF